MGAADRAVVALELGDLEHGSRPVLSARIASSREAVAEHTTGALLELHAPGDWETGTRPRGFRWTPQARFYVGGIEVARESWFDAARRAFETKPRWLDGWETGDPRYAPSPDSAGAYHRPSGLALVVSHPGDPDARHATWALGEKWTVVPARRWGHA